MIEIRAADLDNGETQSLLALHLRTMQSNTPADFVFALDLSGLKVPEITMWSAWVKGRIAGIGALKALDEEAGEIKSMRTHPDCLRQGVATGLLDHIIAQARQRGMRRLSLETGSGLAFEPALALYRGRGFLDGAAFADYAPNPYSQFLHLPLD